MNYSQALLQAIASEIPRERGELRVSTNWALQTVITRQTIEFGHYDSVELFSGSSDVAFHLLCVKLQDADPLYRARQGGPQG